VSTKDKEVEERIISKFKTKVCSGAAPYWYPNHWLAFLLCGRPVDDGFLKVGGNDIKRSPINENALKVLADSSNKANRKLGRQFLKEKKDGEHSSPNTEDEVKLVSDSSIIFQNSPMREKIVRHVRDWHKPCATLEIMNRYKPLLDGYEYQISMLERILRKKPDNQTIEEQIDELREKQLKLITLQNAEMEGQFNL